MFLGRVLAGGTTEEGRGGGQPTDHLHSYIQRTTLCNAGVTDQCIAVAKPCGYESHFNNCSATKLVVPGDRGAVCSADEG